MSRSLTKTTPFKVWSLLEHPKHECLSQTPPFKVEWHIVFMIVSYMACRFPRLHLIFLLLDIRIGRLCKSVRPAWAFFCLGLPKPAFQGLLPILQGIAQSCHRTYCLLILLIAPGFLNNLPHFPGDLPYS